jgi:hypothetical protein
LAQVLKTHQLVTFTGVGTGQHMTNAELSEYALDQIDRAREFLGHEETQEPPESL